VSVGALVGIMLLASLVAGRVDGAAAAARPRAPGPPDPAPTAAHPLQGLRRLTVATIPPVPGMRFAVDGREFVADSSGVATTLVTRSQRAAVRSNRDAHLSVVTPVLEYEPGSRARFAGWSGEGQYRGGGDVPEEYQRATFNIEYLTSFDFTTPEGVSVDPRKFDSMRLRSSAGARLLLRRFTPVWLRGSLAATGPNGLQVRAISYAIDDVRISGATVVHRAQQRFFPSRRQTITVPLLLFDVRFAVRDAFFGGGAGSSINLEYPDGSSLQLPLGRDAAVTVLRLPRGTYQARVSGAGPEYSQQLTVSGDARMELDVLTWLDASLLVGLVLAVLVALLLVGRAMRRRSRRRGELDLVREERAEEPEPEMVGTP
jgi:hypothetical protein